MGSVDRSLDEAYSSAKMYYPVSSLAHDAQHSKISTYQRMVQNAPFSPLSAKDGDRIIPSIWITRYYEKRRYLLIWGFIHALEMLANYYTIYTLVRAHDYTEVVWNILLFMIPRVYTAFLLIGGQKDWKNNPYPTFMFLTDLYPFVELYSLFTVPTTMQEATVLLNPCFVHPTVVTLKAGLGCVPKLIYQCLSFQQIVDTKSHSFIFPVLLAQERVGFVQVISDQFAFGVDAVRLCMLVLIYAPTVLYTVVIKSTVFPDLIQQISPVFSSMSNNITSFKDFVSMYASSIVYWYEVAKVYADHIPLHYIPSILCCVVTISVTLTYVEANAMVNTQGSTPNSTGSYLPSKVAVLMLLRFIHVLLRTFCISICLYTVMLFEYHFAFTVNISTNFARLLNYIPNITVTSTTQYSQVDINISPFLLIFAGIVLYLRYVNEFILMQCKSSPQDITITKPDGEPISTKPQPFNIARTPISTPRFGSTTPRHIPSTPISSYMTSPSTPLHGGQRYNPRTPSSTTLDYTASTPRMNRTFSFSQSQTRPTNIVTIAPYKDSVEQASLSFVAKIQSTFMYLDRRVSLHTVSLTKRVSTLFPVNVRALPPPSYSVFKSNISMHQWYLLHIADNILLLLGSAFFIVLQKTLESLQRTSAPVLTSSGFSFGLVTKNVHWLLREFQYKNVSILPSALLSFVEETITSMVSMLYTQFTNVLSIYTRPLVCDVHHVSDSSEGIVPFIYASCSYFFCYVQSTFYGFSRISRISFLFCAVIIGFIILLTCLPIILAYVYPEGSLLRRIPSMLYKKRIPQANLSYNYTTTTNNTSSNLVPLNSNAFHNYSVPSTPRGMPHQVEGGDMSTFQLQSGSMTPIALSRSSSTAPPSPSQSAFFPPLQGSTYTSNEDGVYQEVVAQKSQNNPRLYVPKKQVDISAYLPPGEQMTKPTGRTPSMLPPNPYSVEFLPSHPTLQTRGYQRTLFSTSSLSPFRTAKATRVAKLNQSTASATTPPKSTTSGWYGVPVMDKDGILLDAIPANGDTTETFLLKTKLHSPSIHTTMLASSASGDNMRAIDSSSGVINSKKRIASIIDEEQSLLTPLKKPKFDLVALAPLDVRTSVSRSNSPEYRLTAKMQITSHGIGLIDHPDHTTALHTLVEDSLSKMSDKDMEVARQVIGKAKAELPRWNPLHDAFGVADMDYVSHEIVREEFVPNMEGNGAYVDEFESQEQRRSVADPTRRVIHTVAPDHSMKDM